MVTERSEKQGVVETSATARRSTGKLGLAFYICQRELASRYAGSILGVLWPIIFPAIQIALYAAVLHFGLRLQVGGGASLLASLIAGMLPWFAFNDALTTMTGSITNNASLVKHLAIPAALLPVSSLLAAGAVHCAMIMVATVVLALLGHWPGLQMVSLLYFGLCLGILTLAIGSILAFANAGFRDVAHAVGPVLGLWFWATPIIWPVERLPANLHWIATANPMSYVVAGYRWSLLGSNAAPVDMAGGLSFWTITAILAVCAWLSFRLFGRELADLV